MRRTLIALFLAIFGAAFANGLPHPEVDCVAAPYTAWALVRHGSFDVGRYAELRPFTNYQVWPTRGGRWVSQRTPGNALVAVPLVAPIAAVRERPLSSLAMLQLGKAVGAGCVAVAACLFFVTCRRLAPDGAWPATILFAFGTCLFSVASQALWMHGPAAMWLCVALFLLTGESADARRTLFAVGLALGLAVLARPTAALFAGATVAALFDRRARAAWVVAGGALPAAALVAYNWHYFGHPLTGGYAPEIGGTSSPPVWVGLCGLLVAPSRGVFVYSPALVFAVWGAVRVFRGAADPTRTLLRAWAAAGAATVLMYARWHEWRGGWCFGPRFLCEAMPIACLLFATAYHGLRARLTRAVAVGLVALSVAIHFVGVHGHGGYVAWHQRHERNDQGRCLFELEDTQIEAHARSFVRETAKKFR